MKNECNNSACTCGPSCACGSNTANCRCGEACTCGEQCNCAAETKSCHCAQ